jgi:hypothetical protein
MLPGHCPLNCIGIVPRPYTRGAADKALLVDALWVVAMLGLLYRFAKWVGQRTSPTGRQRQQAIAAQCEKQLELLFKVCDGFAARLPAILRSEYAVAQ